MLLQTGVSLAAGGPVRVRSGRAASCVAPSVQERTPGQMQKVVVVVVAAAAVVAAAVVVVVVAAAAAAVVVVCLFVWAHKK